MHIRMIEIENFTDNFYENMQGPRPPVAGKYLIRTVSTSNLKTIHFLQARMTINEVAFKLGEPKPFHIDCTNQTVTHISLQPIIK